MRVEQERMGAADVTYASLGSQGIDLQLVGITIISASGGCQAVPSCKTLGGQYGWVFACAFMRVHV